MEGKRFENNLATFEEKMQFKGAKLYLYCDT
jgi:hypothetical protein